MSGWKKATQKNPDGGIDALNNGYSPRLTDLWHKEFDKSIGIIAVIKLDNKYEVRRMEEVQRTGDMIRSLSGLSIKWDGGPVVEYSMNIQTGITEGRTVGTFDTRDVAVARAKEYMYS
jgi:hypothetical protein